MRPLKFGRKAKDYTYLYGSSLDDEESSLTRHLKSAFVEGCAEYTFCFKNKTDRLQCNPGWRNDSLGSCQSGSHPLREPQNCGTHGERKQILRGRDTTT